MDRHPAGWLRWAPLCRLQSGHSSPWLPGARSPQPTVPCLLRPFWKGSPPGQVPWGSPQVPWLRNTALVAAVARKAETTKYGPWVTQAQNRTRAAPGPRGADGVTTTRKQQEHSWESYDALAANWTMRRQREPHQWGLGTSQLGLEGPQWWHRGYANTWLHEVTMITATTQKIKWETHTLPWLLNAKISLQVWKRFLVKPCSGASAWCSWKQDEKVMALRETRMRAGRSMLEMLRLSVWVPLSEDSEWVCINSYAYKRNMDHGNSQLSQPFKCLWICVTNILRQPVLN